MIEEKRDCAFQYYNGREVKIDEVELTLKEANKLWEDNYQNMVNEVKSGSDIEVAIWINMEDKYDYGDTLVHLSSPEVENNVLVEKVVKYYPKNIKNL